VYTLHLVDKEFNMEISTIKTKIMAFQCKEHARSKMCIADIIFEQVNKFNYLGYNFTHNGGFAIENKLKKFNRELRTVNQVFHPENVRKHTRLTAHKTLARTMLIYGTETWTLSKQDEQRLTIDEMKVMRRTAGYSVLEHVINKQILGKMKLKQ
jgi:hypothetical protein